MYRTKIYGHRGTGLYAPENTMEAFCMAYDMGADGIELDVQMTKDGYLVVAHDEEISRVSDGTGFIKDYYLDELRNFHFNKNHPKYKGAKIPLLEEVLDYFKQKNFLFNIELKNGMFPYTGMEEKVLQMVKDRGMLDRVIFSSFNHKSMVVLRGLEKKVQVAFLLFDKLVYISYYIKEYGVDIVHPVWYQLNEEGLLEELHQDGIMVNVWTVDSGKEIRRLCDMGVDGIITNKPDLGSEIRDDDGR